MRARVVDVAIVGGGSVGVSFLHQLILSLPPDTACSVALFEPQAAVGPGTAYQADANSNLLNIPVSRMSALAEQPDSFLDWLRRQTPAALAELGIGDVDPSDFVSRPAFGRYMAEIYAQALAMAAARGIAVHRYAETVLAVDPSRTDGTPTRRARVRATGGVQIDAGRVALCLGNLPSTTFSHLAGAQRYLNSPYPVAAMARAIGKRDDVCVVGTSLSAIDALVALQAAGHQGAIHCVSRNGRLPSVRSPHNKKVGLPLLPEPEADGRVTLDGLVASLRRALLAAGGQEDLADILGSTADAALALDDEIARSQLGPRVWQSVAAATNERIEHIWHALDEHERLRFHRDWRTLWMARRATFPLRNALNVQALLRTGRLRVHGGFEQAAFDAHADRFVVRAGGHVLRARWLINATSFSLDVGGAADPLVRQLCDQGHARPHPLGGFDLDFDSGCLIDTQGQVVRAISVLGSLAAGTYFWTTSMEINARLALGQARQVATALCAMQPDACQG